MIKQILVKIIHSRFTFIVLFNSFIFCEVLHKFFSTFLLWFDTSLFTIWYLTFLKESLHQNRVVVKHLIMNDDVKIYRMKTILATCFRFSNLTFFSFHKFSPHHRWPK